MKFYLPNVAVLLAAGAFACQAQQSAPPDVIGTSSNSYSWQVGDTRYFTNGVMASNQAYTVMAGAGAFNDLTGDVQAEGDVVILDHGHIWRGTNAIYNFKTGEVRTTAFKSVQMPFNISGDNLMGNSNRVFTASNTWVTTDDYAKPIYRIHAKSITIAPGQYIEMHEATLYLGSTPVFYFPSYRRSLVAHPDNFEFLPGYRSTFGPYLLGAYNWYGQGPVDGTIHLDERERRGLAFGPDLLLHLGDFGQAAFRYYYAHDHDPNADGLNLSNVAENEQRASLYYQSAPSTNFNAKVVASYENDPTIIRDFFESEYRQDVQPESFAEVNQLWPNFTIDAMAQPRLVKFFETVERLPDLKLTGLRQEVGVTPVYYESETSMGYYRKAFSDTNLPFQTNYEGTRADTVQQFSLPETFFGWLTVTPRVGGRMTYYGDVDGVNATTNSQGRGVFNTGVEFSLKASRVYRDVESSFWDLDGLRHIIEPDINYSYIPAPSRSPSELPQYDTAMPSLRQLPLEFPDYNSIDSIDRQNLLRLTLRNILQTKRADGIEDVVNWAVYTDWNLTPGTNHIIDDIYQDVTLRPRTWLVLDSSTRYDLPDHRWRDSVNSLTITPNNTWSFSLGYRYLMNNDPEFLTVPGEMLPGHNLVSGSLYYRMNENWGAHIMERYEAQNGVLQEQDYSIYRDLRSWTAALVFRLTQGVGQPNDFTVAITLSLKAFPRFPLGSDSDRPSNLTTTSSVADSMGVF
jgi:LPS-assembly protein